MLHARGDVGTHVDRMPLPVFNTAAAAATAPSAAPLATPDSYAGSTTAGTLPAAAAARNPRAGELA